MADDTRPRFPEAGDPQPGGAESGGGAGSVSEAAGTGNAGSVDGGDACAESPESRLETLQQQADGYRDQALRAQAEAENTRRRAARDVENAHKFALERFAAELLPVLDSLEKAVEVAGEAAGAEPIAEGVELSLKLFLSVLEKQGIERIDPAGEPFDPQVHEALAMVPSDHAEPNSVLEVMQRGYKLNGRVVRAAKVVVAKAPEPVAGQ